ncbi:MAG: hypothetical protein WA081_22080 [Desulfosalsimonadaceae bacterium]
MFKKIIACCVLLIFSVTIIQDVEAGEAGEAGRDPGKYSNSADWEGFKESGETALLIIGGVIVVMLVIFGVSKAASMAKKKTPTDEPDVVPKEDTPSLSLLKADIPMTTGTENMSVSAVQNTSIEVSDAGIVILKW